MLFDILLWVTVLIPLVFLGVSYLQTSNLESRLFSFVMGVIIAVLPGSAVLAYWNNHADDLATISEQERMIVVYEQQRNDLKQTLADFSYPQSGALMNQDTPVASIVAQLGATEKSLSFARADLAKAHKNITARKLGPMSGVVDFVGTHEN